MVTDTSIGNCLFGYMGDNCATAKLQFHGNNSYFRKYFHMLFAVKEGEIQNPNRALSQI